MALRALFRIRMAAGRHWGTTGLPFQERLSEMMSGEYVARFGLFSAF
jgi:hypothetical protein